MLGSRQNLKEFFQVKKTENRQSHSVTDLGRVSLHHGARAPGQGLGQPQRQLQPGARPHVPVRGALVQVISPLIEFYLNRSCLSRLHVLEDPHVLLGGKHRYLRRFLSDEKSSNIGPSSVKRFVFY